MEDGSITNEQITASSYWQYHRDENVACPPWDGRLNNVNGYWVRGDNDLTPWIQVALASAVTITAIQTQGAKSGVDGEVWVTELQIQTGDSEDTLSYIMNESKPAVSIPFSDW